jgi:hypothetical protein
LQGLLGLWLAPRFEEKGGVGRGDDGRGCVYMGAREEGMGEYKRHARQGTEDGREGG